MSTRLLFWRIQIEKGKGDCHVSTPVIAQFDILQRTVLLLAHDRKLVHVLCFYQVTETWVGVWENENCCGDTSQQASGSTALFSSLKLPCVFYNFIEMQQKCFLFLLENSTTKKSKQLVYFDHQNVNSLCLHHHYVNSSCWFCVSFELWKHDFKPISAHIFFGLFCNIIYNINSTFILNTTHIVFIESN